MAKRKPRKVTQTERAKIRAQHDALFPGTREHRRMTVAECVDSILEHERLQKAADFHAKLLEEEK